MVKISVDQISKEITKQLRQYTNEVKEADEKIKEKVTKDGVSELKQTSPKEHGKYAKSWTRKMEGTDITIHNKVYQLTHLLEDGHMNRDGSRTAGRTHIKPVEEKVIKEYVDGIEKAIQS